PLFRFRRAESYLSGARDVLADSPAQARDNIGLWLSGAVASAAQLKDHLAGQPALQSGLEPLAAIQKRALELEGQLSSGATPASLLPACRALKSDYAELVSKISEDEYWKTAPMSWFGLKIPDNVLGDAYRFTARHIGTLESIDAAATSIVMPPLGSAMFAYIGAKSVCRGIVYGSAEEILLGGAMMVPLAGRLAAAAGAGKALQTAVGVAEGASAIYFTGTMAASTYQLLSRANRTYLTFDDLFEAGGNVAMLVGLPLATRSLRPSRKAAAPIMEAEAQAPGGEIRPGPIAAPEVSESAAPLSVQAYALDFDLNGSMRALRSGMPAGDRPALDAIERLIPALPPERQYAVFNALRLVLTREQTAGHSASLMERLGEEFDQLFSLMRRSAYPDFDPSVKLDLALTRAYDDGLSLKQILDQVSIARAYLEKYGSNPFMNLVLTQNFGRLTPPESAGRRLSFEKTGGALIPLSGRQSGVLVRIMDAEHYETWKRASVYAGENGKPVARVFTRYCGERLEEFEAAHPEWREELSRQQADLQAGFDRLGIDVGRKISHNLVVEMAAGKPVLRYIDFDDVTSPRTAADYIEAFKPQLLVLGYKIRPSASAPGQVEIYNDFESPMPIPAARLGETVAQLRRAQDLGFILRFTPGGTQISLLETPDQPRSMGLLEPARVPALLDQASAYLARFPDITFEQDAIGSLWGLDHSYLSWSALHPGRDLLDFFGELNANRLPHQMLEHFPVFTSSMSHDFLGLAYDPSFTPLRRVGSAAVYQLSARSSDGSPHTLFSKFRPVYEDALALRVQPMLGRTPTYHVAPLGPMGLEEGARGLVVESVLSMGPGTESAGLSIFPGGRLHPRFVSEMGAQMADHVFERLSDAHMRNFLISPDGAVERIDFQGFGFSRPPTLNSFLFHFEEGFFSPDDLFQMRESFLSRWSGLQGQYAINRGQILEAYRDYLSDPLAAEFLKRSNAGYLRSPDQIINLYDQSNSMSAPRAWEVFQYGF
ncbi:MAG: hypothetical protein KGH63_02520, partial [Candidatus Micrarchaeota archaeon]|nr:hypothetical protein [Candidatus Micrarchaeota archaeon]